MGLNNFTTKGGGTAEFTDVESDSITSDSLTAQEVTVNGKVITERVGNAFFFAGGFPGSTPDARLQNALDSSGNGSTIHLERADYQNDFVINQQATHLIGTEQSKFSNGNTITIDQGRCALEGFTVGRFQGSKIEINGGRTTLERMFFPEVIIDQNANNCVILANRGGAVTDNSGTAEVVANTL